MVEINESTESNNKSYQHWQLEVDENAILWLGFSRHEATVNSFNLAALDELNTIINNIKTDEKYSGVIIYSAKEKGFIAGADLEEFAKVKSSDDVQKIIQTGQNVFNELASLTIPTVAMIKGFCLGGGLELALACRYRVAENSDQTRLGAPEIKLGIYPGWGGSVRLPRLIGAPQAMNLMLTGRTVSTRAAKKMGLIDAAVPLRQLKRAAQYYITEKPALQQPALLTRLSNSSISRPILAKILRKKTAAKVQKNHYPAPFLLIDTWLRMGVQDKKCFTEEANSVVQLFSTPTAKNLGRVFFLSERLKGLSKNIESDIEHVHVVGAGVMGGDIAAFCALKGFKVTLQDTNPEAIAATKKRAYKLYQKKLRRPRPIQAAMDRLIPDTAGVGVQHADLIIEAIVENVAAKQDLLRTLESQCKKSAIIASNTSTIPLAQMNTALQKPERLVGIHFFNPVAMLPLVEVIKDTATSQLVFEQSLAFVNKLGKFPLPVTSTPGFLVNRILMPYLLEAMYLLEEGVKPQVIDQLAVNFGMPMGPVELADRVGLDICLSSAKTLLPIFGGTVPKKLEKMVEEGQLGQKSGQGFYQYKNGKVIKKKEVDKPARADVITQRLIYSMLNQVVACLDDKVVADGEFLDSGMIFGTGFAPFLGGPIHYINSIGKQSIVEKLQSFEQEFGQRFKPHSGWQSLTSHE